LYTTDAGPVVPVASPLDIAGCALWLDASDPASITASSGEVTAWADKSATGSSWTRVGGANGPATGTQTMGGKNVVVFDGTNDGLSAVTPLNTSMPLTFFVVQRVVSGSVAGMTYTAGTGDNFNWRQAADTLGTLEVTVGGSRMQLGGALLSQNTLYSLTVPASSNASIYRDGTVVSITTNAALKPTLTGTHYLGRRSDGFYGNVHIAEIVAYSAELTTADRARVEAYLAAKWSISGVHAPATASSDPVGYWGDRSGNGRHAVQATAGSRPTVGSSSTAGKNAVRNNGTGSVALQVAAWPYTAGNTQFAVFNASAINQGIYQRGSLNDEPRMAIQTGANGVASVRATRGGSVLTQTHSEAGYALSQWAIGGTLFNTALGRAYRDGVYGADTTDSQPFSGDQELRLLSLPGNIYGINGGIAEFLYYDRQLTATEVSRVAGYLSRRWGITLAPQVANADAQNWIDRVYANGGTVSSATASAVNTFCDAIDAASLRAAMYRTNLFCGSNLNAALVPLYLTPDKTVTNLFQFGTDMTNSVWLGGGNGNVTRTATTEAGPLGYGYATKLTTPSAPFDIRQMYQQMPLTGQQATVSAWMKTSTGTRQIQWLAGNTYTDTVTVTSTWQRFTKTFTLPTATDARTGFSTVSELSDAAGFIYVWGMQCEYGPTATSYNQPQYGNATDTNTGGLFVSGNYSESGGLVGDGSTKYLKTGLASNQLAGGLTGHASIWRGAGTVATTRIAIGGSDNDVDDFEIQERPASTVGAWGKTSFTSSSTGGVAGLKMINRSSSTRLDLYSNGSSIANSTASVVVAPHANEFYVFGGNRNGTLTLPVALPVFAYSLGVSMDATQATAYYNALSSFQNSLSRT
jgi:hypothetical protein